MSVGARDAYAQMTSIIERIAKNELQLETERKRLFKLVSRDFDLKKKVIPEIEKVLKTVPPAEGFDVEVPLAFARQCRMNPDSMPDSR